MKTEKETIKERLDEELQGVSFQGQRVVLARTHPRTWTDRLRAVWNAELEIPLVPAGGAAVLLLVCVMTFWSGGEKQSASPTRRGELVEAGGNVYWKEDWEKAVRRSDRSDQG